MKDRADELNGAVRGAKHDDGANEGRGEESLALLLHERIVYEAVLQLSEPVE